MSSASSTTLMTEGSISKHILKFAIPIFWGNLFQQMYNTVDSLIVGRYLGNESLAAVSSSSNLIFLLVGFFGGVSIGAGVVIARYFGAQDMKRVHDAIHTTVALGLICGVLLTILGVFCAPFILKLMGTPAEVLAESVTYFRIYFAGSLGFILYNSFVGILRAVGDSKHPLYYLVFASLLNIVLDLVLIAGFGFGVGAAALATIISQITSAILCLIQLLRSPQEFRLYPKDIRLHGDMVRQIIRNGLPAGFENSIISIANVFIQSAINSFGTNAIAGCGSYTKIQGFSFIPVNSFTAALSTFISQNLGAKQHERAKKGARFGLICCAVLAEMIGVFTYIFAPQLMSAFSDVPEVIECGVQYARVNGLFFFFVAFTHTAASIVRGSGNGTFSMYVYVFTWCVVRIVYISVMVKLIPSIQVIFWAYPLTWALSTIVFSIYLLKSDWVHGLD